MNPRHTTNQSARGFSMIDVLVSIIVMATALLALAVLQGTLTRNTADARARSQIAQLGDGLIDKVRQVGYSSLANGSTTISPTAPTSPAVCPSASTANSTGVGKLTAANMLYCAQQASGVSGLSAARTVTTYTYADSNVPNGSKNADCTNTFVTNVKTCPPSNNVSEYKNVSYVLTWTDASGASRTLTENTIISPLALDTGGGLATNVTFTGSTNSPIVRELSPVVPGVIPIAIGANTDTAATNPRPELSSTTNATSYNVLTYKDLTSQVQIQQRIETTVVGCSCQYGQQSATRAEFVPAWRPTYWDGTHYVEPAPAHDSPSGQASSAPSTQSPLCTYCCRDHHDYSGDLVDLTTGNTFKDDPIQYDPFRFAAGDTEHAHYRWTTSPAAFVKVGAGLTGDTSKTYLESCRMIRVNGLWRTATDLNADLVGFVATDSQSVTGVPTTPASTQPATSWIPSASAETEYQDFVKEYFNEKIAQKSSPVATTLYNTFGLDDPATLYYTGTSLYLHTRGLYLDNLEDAAKKQIQSAIDHCTGSTIDCILPYIPFSSINLTELALFGAPTPGMGVASPANLQVTNVGTLTGDFTTIPPIHGTVSKATGGGNEDDILVKMTSSNSGVAGGVPGSSQQSIDPNDAIFFAHYASDPTLVGNPSPAPAYTDMQHFRVRATPGDGFTVNITGLTQTSDSITNNDPVLAWYTNDGPPPTDSNDCVGSIDQASADPNPYTCNTDLNLTTAGPPAVSGPDLQLWVSKYNYIKYVTEANPCDSTQTVVHPYCEYSAVSEVDVSPSTVYTVPPLSVDTTTNSGKVSEISKFVVPQVPKTGTIGIKFVFTGETAATPKACDTTTVPGQSIFPGFNTPPCQ